MEQALVNMLCALYHYLAENVHTKDVLEPSLILR